LIRYGYPFCRIPLSQGKFAIVDPDDYFRLARYKWYAVKGGRTFYAVRSIVTKEGKRYRSHMHRVVLRVPDNMHVDHINCNGLDNRKANLRPATCAQNIRNRKKIRRNGCSKYKGLTWVKYKKKWRVRITLNRTRIILGDFSDEIEAAKAYDRAAVKYHGQFAALNFPNKKQKKTTAQKA
jgi:hypothetical protein